MKEITTTPDPALLADWLDEFAKHHISREQRHISIHEVSMLSLISKTLRRKDR